MSPFRVYPQTAMPLGSRCLRLGCRGRDVLALQRELTAAGLLAEADGRYGYLTETAVRKLQAKCRLPRDGVAGPDTIAGMRAIREGQGLLIHRVKRRETVEGVANALGVAPDVLRQQNPLPRRGKIPAGQLVSVRARLLLLEADGKPPSIVRFTAILGPPVALSEASLALPEQVEASGLPVLTADEKTWDRLLREPGPWPEIAAHLAGVSTGRWAVALPARLWWRKRRLLRILSVWQSGEVAGPVPLLEWPAKADPLPDLSALSRLSDYLLIDPWTLTFWPRQVARLLREVARVVPSSRLILLVRAGGLLATPRDGLVRKSIREARAAAATERARLIWNETDRIYTAAWEQAWDLRLLEERGLRGYARLVDRLDCAGIALGGLSGLSLPAVKVWPGEFAVLDSFSSPRHID